MSLERTKRLIEEHHITMKENSSKADRDSGGTIYSVTLFFEERQMTMPNYFQGPAYRKGAQIEYVLNALLDDAASIENNPSKELWLYEYASWGEEQYDDCLRQTKELKDFLGEYYETFLWEEA